MRLNIRSGQMNEKPTSDGVSGMIGLIKSRSCCQKVPALFALPGYLGRERDLEFKVNPGEMNASLQFVS